MPDWQNASAGKCRASYPAGTAWLRRAACYSRAMNKPLVDEILCEAGDRALPVNVKSRSWSQGDLLRMGELFCAAMQRELDRTGKSMECSIARGPDRAPMRSWRAWGEGAMPVHIRQDESKARLTVCTPGRRSDAMLTARRSAPLGGPA